MIKNIFLTGKLHIGKSTIINKAVNELALTPGGFRTVSTDKVDGIFNVHIVDAGVPEAFTDENRVGECDSKKRESQFIAFPEVFDSVGVLLLTKAKKSPLVIMDELGFMETNAMLFRKAVHNCLDDESPVLGVLKQTDSSFLNEVRTRSDVMVIEVNENNRANLAEVIINLVKKVR